MSRRALLHTFERGPIASTARFLNLRLPRFYWLVTVVPRLMMGAVWIRRVARLGLGHPLSDLNFPDFQHSDTVFVLATGASINRYQQSRWDTIDRHDSIGMNFFMLHEFVPDLYVMEAMNERHRRLLKVRSDAYRDVPIILKSQLVNLSVRRVQARFRDLEQNPPDVRNRFYLSLDLLVAGHDVPHMYSGYELMKRFGLFKTKPRFLLLTKRRGSITYIINLAVRIGYKRIVLCGVDLDHAEYFYDSRREALEAEGLPVPPNPHDGTVHDTYDPRKHPVTVKDVIIAMNEAVLEPLGVELYVGDRSSALHPHFPEYPWYEG